MKIYTKSGDAGRTMLASGEKVSKHDPRVELYGECDELNSQIGLAVALMETELAETRQRLLGLQSLLFEVASELAGFRPYKKQGSLSEQDTLDLEDAIDQMTVELPPLQSFILPGGHPAAAAMHVCRTVCRRLERKLVATIQNDPEAQNHNISDLMPAFFNRLSDYCFVQARALNQHSGHQDIPWQSRISTPKKKGSDES